MRRVKAAAACGNYFRDWSEEQSESLTSTRRPECHWRQREVMNINAGGCKERRCVTQGRVGVVVFFFFIPHKTEKKKLH